ncbi:MAG: ABC transporter ATP-binding protein [bacterium]|nr:MAG: ABC transporter ATP-binding protein [bacterium]
MTIQLLKVSKLYRQKWSGPGLIPGVAGRGSTAERSFYAVKDVDLDIAAGQSVGIIGQNGSGKSTLLRLMAGIVHSSAGEVRVKGHLSAVLDVHSGLHPKLTGRQNIYLKGAIYGLDKRETDSRVHEIVAFSGLEEFIDWPISKYSSGMIIRLGFSIAMHMDFDILLMDEVLSVGDIVFQRQCLARVRRFLGEGKTIVLASHNLGDVAAIASRVVLLRNGRVQYDGGAEEVLKAYWQESEKEQNRIPRHLHPFDPANVYGMDTGEMVIEEVSFLDGDGKQQEVFRTGEAMSVSIRFNCRVPVRSPLFRVQFFRSDGLWVHGANTARSSFDMGLLSGEGEIVLDYSRINFLDGDYYVTVGVWPDEHRSSFTDIAYDCRKWSYLIRIESSREDGGGIVSNPFSWRLKSGAGRSEALS